MLWLDQVLAVPTIGILTEPSLTTAHENITAIRSVLESWVRSGSLSIEDRGPFSIAFDYNGFRFNIDHENIVAQFSYRHSVEKSSSSLPELRYMRSLEPYSALLNEEVDILKQIVAAVIRGRSRAVRRVGIMANCKINAEKPPPGIDSFLQHLGKPWNKPIKVVSTNLMAEVGASTAYHDRCHHHMDINLLDRPNSLDFRLDWQRLFEKSFPLQINEFDDQLIEWRDSALAYFEKFGAGDLTYGSD